MIPNEKTRKKIHELWVDLVNVKTHGAGGVRGGGVFEKNPLHVVGK